MLVSGTKSSMFVLPNIGKIYHILALDKDTQFVGQSLAFLDTVELAGRAAELNRPALVVGQRGTGKELIAERNHRLSSRWSGPLLVLHCARSEERRAGQECVSTGSY